MAQRRMFSPKIIDSDAFLDMPIGSQLLYFHLCMRADDDGFVGNPKRIMRLMGAQEDDFKVLIAKRFILTFQSGVVVIKHWKIHNLIRHDRYNQTQYIDEKNSLLTKENGAYTEWQPNDNQLAPQVRLGQDRLGKNTGPRKRVRVALKPKEKKAPEYTAMGAKVLKAFEEVDPKNKTYYANKTQRGAADFLVSEHGLEQVLKVVAILPKTNATSYYPSITSPNDLKEKWVKLEAALVRKKGEKISKGRGFTE